MSGGGRCKTCKFWQTQFKLPFESSCACPQIVYRGDATGSEREPPVDGLVYYDAEAYHAYIMTGPEFGCIHWERR